LKKILIASTNKKKLTELQDLLSGLGLDLISLSEFKFEEVAETGKTFEENASLKAAHAAKTLNRWVIADDSGLIVSFLNGKPGVYSARFAGPGCTYQDNNRKLLRLLKNVPASKRRAKFVCVMSLYENGRRVRTVRGECAGRIGFAERGKRGFGYDPVFIPQGSSKSFAELGPAAKNKISHRGKALRAAKKVVLNYLKKNR